MAWKPISKIVPQYVDGNGDPYSGAVLKAYETGTTTNINFATDSAGGTTAGSIALNATGYPEVSGNIVIPHVQETAFKLALYPTQAAADADSSAIWTIDGISALTVPDPGYFRGEVFGFDTSNGSDADHDIDITAGSCVDTTAAETIQTTSTTTIAIDAAAGINSIDTGTVAADTLYAIWALKNTSTGAVGFVFSTSFTFSGVTKPSGYDVGQLIGAVITDSSSNIIAFTQSDNYFRFTGDIILQVNDTSLTNETFETLTVDVPPNSIAHLYALHTDTSHTGNLSRVYVRTAGAADDATLNREAWAYADQESGNFDGVGGIGMVMVDSSSQIEYAAYITSSGGIDISLIGFIMTTRGNGA